ncbi:helix-turn-helix domain-containing protein [Celeribacter sp. PS-C1]|uniref:helix-turn-helix domain-containing protein n=1 Tax=Celeribacter sp. PS-C1 TaxID=2820813 RepID=UPI001C67EC4C|nr:helix-turn-helix transcriptional regulator [Celeribacter sp. PS-C1]MBW6418302.1 helix-turn-helix domain-containing protein [Celeribacter sp. PS-C1]
MNAHSVTFAERLKNLREKNGMSKTRLASEIGVSTTCVWNWEEGNTEPREHNLTELAKVLGVSPTMLTADESTPVSAPLPTNQDLPTVIAEAKQTIAKLAGISPSQVKISLDY